MDTTTKSETFQSVHLLHGANALRAIFDAVYYLRRYPDIAAAGVDPLTHYLDTGWTEGRDPSALFDTDYYLDNNSDVLQAGINPLLHFVTDGAREGRKPNPLFDPDWYRARYPDIGDVNPLAHYAQIGAAARLSPNPLFDAVWYVSRNADAAANPLAHYLEHGRARGLSPHPLLDAPWYLNQYPDVAESGMDPLAHYLMRGHLEARQPHPHFDAIWYLQQNPDVAKAGMNPLLHYLLAGKDEGRLPEPPRGSAHVEQPAARHEGSDASRPDLLQHLVRDHAYYTNAGPEFEEFDPAILAGRSVTGVQPLLLAYYLPQFHPIEENDKFWGRGFTEWRQLARGAPRFPGHYQPRIPRDLGFYDLRDEKALAQQVAMALASGINGFVYYYYWFNGRRVLEKPLEVLLDSTVEMPFALLWANENWTRTWDGSESEVLLRQDYLPEDEDALLNDFARHFADRRYIRINGRPLFIIYNPRSIPDASQTIARWRERLAREFGFEPLIFMAQTFEVNDPTPFGLDGAIEFPPHKLAGRSPEIIRSDMYQPGFEGRIIAYDDFAKASLEEPAPDYPLIKTIVPSWDNDARRPNRGLCLDRATPDKYQNWLTSLLKRAHDHPINGVPIVAVNAWNEWAESAYLEPDVHFGAAYLNATARAYAKACTAPSPVSVIVPNYNHEAFLEARLNSIIHQSHPPGEIIFLDDCSTDGSVALARRILVAANIPHRIIVNDRNSGNVFRQWMKGVELAQHALIWIAESDDSADPEFLGRMVRKFNDEDVLAAFGRISYIDEAGAPIADLDGYYAGLSQFDWDRSQTIAAAAAFTGDFAVQNVVPNASGLVFRKPNLSERERERLFAYRFAGDWYFYMLLLRGGSLAYDAHARSFFRRRSASTSNAAFFTDRHLAEHKMLLADLRDTFGLDPIALQRHAERLSPFFADMPRHGLLEQLTPAPSTQKRPLRIGIGAHSFNVGGGEILPVFIANALRARGHHVSYLVLDRKVQGRGIRDRLRDDIPVAYWQEIADLPRFVRDHKLDVFNSHNVGWEVYLGYRGVDLNVPYVSSLHGGYETVTEHFDDANFRDFVTQKVSQWLYLADKNASLLTARGVDPRKLTHSFNAIPTFDGEWIDRASFREEHGIPSDAFVLVLCSRALEEKGWRTAIELAGATTSARPIHLVLIGDGPFLPTARKLAREAGNITILGHVDQPMRFFRACDAGIFPSTYSGESFPLFLLECFQAGLPVIASTIGEIPQLLQGDMAELLVAHDIGPDTMRAAMTQLALALADNPARYARMQRAAHEANARYSIDRLADFYVETFQALARRD